MVKWSKYCNLIIMAHSVYFTLHIKMYMHIKGKNKFSFHKFYVHVLSHLKSAREISQLSQHILFNNGNFSAKKANYKKEQFIKNLCGYQK